MPQKVVALAPPPYYDLGKKTHDRDHSPPPVFRRNARRSDHRNRTRRLQVTRKVVLLDTPKREAAPLPRANRAMQTMYELLPADRALADAVPSGTLFAVGGRVRDELRRQFEDAHVALKDLDYVVTGVEPAELEQRLRGIGRVDLVGASFAVFKVTFDGRTVDVALPRREVSVGIGHRDFTVESGPKIPLEDDLARRDFRMNMIARALPSGDLVDPHGGAADIRARRIDILTPRTFEEDPLRMLRAAQCAARFGYTLTDTTRDAMAASAALVQSVSAERIAEEFNKLLVQAPQPSIGLELLRETGVLRYVWPELLEGMGVRWKSTRLNSSH